MIFRIQFIQMRIYTGKSDYEIIVRRHGWRIKGTDEILEKRITVKIITPAVDGSVAKVLHKDERTYKNGGIDGRSACIGVQTEEKIGSQSRVELLKFVQSRAK